MDLPEEIIVNVESKTNINAPEIQVENEGGKIKTSVKIPDETEKFFEFNIPTKSITDGEVLEKDKLEVALKDNFAQVAAQKPSTQEEETII